MSRLTSHVLYAAVLGQLVAQLGWIDPLFVPLVLAAPPLTGALLAVNRVGFPGCGAVGERRPGHAVDRLARQP